MTARLLVIGFDAVETPLLERLADEGRLPALDPLRQQAVTARTGESVLRAIADIDTLDLAPTLLALLEVPAPDDLDGVAIEGLVGHPVGPR